MALPLHLSKVMKLENKDWTKYLSNFFNCIGLYMGMRLPLHIKKLWGNGVGWTSHPLVCKEFVKEFLKKIQQTNMNALYTPSSKTCEKMKK
jgi:hypothetical protein